MARADMPGQRMFHDMLEPPQPRPRGWLAAVGVAPAFVSAVARLLT